MSASYRCRRRYVGSCRHRFFIQLYSASCNKMTFKYDVVSLIELIESKPCLWDKTNENNKNKILRDKSWQEIFEYLEDGYDQLSQTEKKKMGDSIMNKWSNIRDSFLRSLRTKSGQGAKRNYIYSEHLQFLLKITDKDQTKSNFNRATIEDDNTEIEEFTVSQQPSPVPPQCASQLNSTPSTSNVNRFKSKRKLDIIEQEILAELKKGQPILGNTTVCHPPRSDQEMLLLSFLPYTRDMSESELMDLQMEILTTIKSIKRRRTSIPTQQQQHVNVSPAPSPAMSQSDQSSLQTFDYQSPLSSNHTINQQQEPSLRYFNDFQM